MHKLTILGIRGIPACHGGFETFAERLALHLVGRGWRVTVYCQTQSGEGVVESEWRGVRLIHVPVSQRGALGSVVFDFKAITHSLGGDGVFLTLGYNTAIFNLLHRLKRKVGLINMDGIEWRRAKWGPLARFWFWFNERIGCLVGDHLVADHPAIKTHLCRVVHEEKITMIPYGAEGVCDADVGLLSQYDLAAGEFSIVIARPEPENSILEMVRAFSLRTRGHKMVVLGALDPERNSYHRRVIDAASDEVVFLGAIYEAPLVRALRFYSRFYLHGHTVGGTNPSLVEALGAGCAVIAHDNVFNRWVAGPSAAYFADEASCAHIFDELIPDNAGIRVMRSASRKEFAARFTWYSVLQAYEDLLGAWHPRDAAQ